MQLERTWGHRAGSLALLASDTPERPTLPLGRWLPARYHDAYTWPVPAERVRREDGITNYDAAEPVDEPMLSTVSADGRWVVTSFTAAVGNVWSNPELTCQHVDPTPPLPTHGTAVAESKLLVTRGPSTARSARSGRTGPGWQRTRAPRPPAARRPASTPALGGIKRSPGRWDLESPRLTLVQHSRPG